jgi:hypothetical protein
MWNTKDLAFIIIFAVLGLVYSVFIVQMVNLISGVPGTTYFFLVGFAIFISCQLLLFEGRRWMFFVSTALFMILIIPIPFGGKSYDILARVPLLISGFTGDIIFNGAYNFFKKRNKLLCLTILFSIQYHTLNSFYAITLYYLFYPEAAFVAFLNTALVMMPVIIIESIAGGYIGYKVYQRVRNILVK